MAGVTRKGCYLAEVNFASKTFNHYLRDSSQGGENLIISASFPVEY